MSFPVGRTRSGALAVTVAFGFVLALPLVAVAAGSAGGACAASKLGAAAKALTAKAKCHGGALKKGGTVDSTCLAKAEAGLNVAFAAAEAKGGCATSGDQVAIKAIVDDAVAQLVAALPAVSTTTTTTTLPCGAGAGDGDGDGFAEADGDCDDCNPLVNPGAIEVAANGLDDDCDATVDNAAGACDSGLALDDTDPADGARALGLCAFPTGGSGRWGVLSASYVRAAGGAAAPGPQIGLMGAFGPNVSAQEGARMLVLSSGTARSTSDPGYSSPYAGYGTGTPPANFPHSESCLIASAIADDLALKLQVRVPTNAVGYRFRLNYYTRDYPAWLCTNFVDQYVTLVDPAPSGSYSGDVSGFNGEPVSANSPYVDVCDGCLGGTSQLLGTGFESHGATGWETVEASASPGSTIQIRFLIWDTGDQAIDSTVLLDGFEWILASPGP